MGSALKSLGASPIIVGGVSDHVHLLCVRKPDTSTAMLVKEVKRVSSAWMKEQDSKWSAFAWQRGYGAFSVSASDTQAVTRYIQNQHEHHRTVTWEEEVRMFLERARIEFDERFLDD